MSNSTSKIMIARDMAVTLKCEWWYYNQKSKKID